MLRGSLLINNWGSPHGQDGSSPMNTGYCDGHVKSTAVMAAANNLTPILLAGGFW
jgi:prepilin-type processing-associated H-X9-DG protein